VRLPIDNPEGVWDQMKDRLINHQDVAGALAHFHSIAVEAYREAFFSFGVAKIAADIIPLGR
jgi:hypothetical protein